MDYDPADIATICNVTPGLVRKWISNGENTVPAARRATPPG